MKPELVQGQFGRGSPVITGLTVDLVEPFPGRESGAGARAALVRGRRSSFPKSVSIPVVPVRRAAAWASLVFPKQGNRYEH